MAQSEFYKDLSKIEKKYHGISLKKIKIGFQFFEITLIALVESFLVPDWAFYLVTLPTALFLGTIPALDYMDKWKRVRRKLELFFVYEDNFYTTGQIRRYEANEFIEKDNICETGDFLLSETPNHAF